MKLKQYLLFGLGLIISSQVYSVNREKYNFNSDWLLEVGDFPQAQQIDYQDATWFYMIDYDK